MTDLESFKQDLYAASGKECTYGGCVSASLCGVCHDQKNVGVQTSFIQKLVDLAEKSIALQQNSGSATVIKDFWMACDEVKGVGKG